MSEVKTFRGQDAAAGSHPVAFKEEGDRIAELEQENARLQRLVAELLITNQRLRATG